MSAFFFSFGSRSFCPFGSPYMGRKTNAKRCLELCSQLISLHRNTSPPPLCCSLLLLPRKKSVTPSPPRVTFFRLEGNPLLITHVRSSPHLVRQKKTPTTAGEPGRPTGLWQLPAAELLGLRVLPHGDHVHRGLRRHLLQDRHREGLPGPVPARRTRKSRCCHQLPHVDPGHTHTISGTLKTSFSITLLRHWLFC